ncbi:MAG: hypothetical protein A4E52_02034 [Pelotomaculum sp. PtaB.Bin013]|uniref:Spi protease inhibitor domain-containing protein n=1 Tax=Pelotomaculum isophthalicicum JI TaxID=947010 RepID=A0A9X4GZ49_9FIRM|nr:hypothetical protein [Pelotomaculum isophthalicicum]MDF9408377.1 hypothetical protein [Pelotomaculum isophthalicicum JI]OPX82665.1 MAG: hypothetical protein A4E52_02034 [Pelotomaculum sp. PtaB.Bin013]
MKTARLIIALLIFTSISGCAMDEKKLSDDQGRKTIVTMDQAITEYLENSIIPILPPPGVKTFAAYDLLGVSENGDEKTAYMLADIWTYGVEPSVGIGPRSASFLPLALILREENGGFTVVGHRQPRDGSNNWPDIKQIFPEEYHERILDYHKTGKGQEMEQSIRERVNNYLKTVGIENTV